MSLVPPSAALCPYPLLLMVDPTICSLLSAASCPAPLSPSKPLYVGGTQGPPAVMSIPREPQGARRALSGLLVWTRLCYLPEPGELARTEHQPGILNSPIMPMKCPRDLLSSPLPQHPGRVSTPDWFPTPAPHRKDSLPLSQGRVLLFHPMCVPPT